MLAECVKRSFSFARRERAILLRRGALVFWPGWVLPAPCSFVLGMRVHARISLREFLIRGCFQISEARSPFILFVSHLFPSRASRAPLILVLLTAPVYKFQSAPATAPSFDGHSTSLTRSVSPLHRRPFPRPSSAPASAIRAFFPRVIA